MKKSLKRLFTQSLSFIVLWMLARRIALNTIISAGARVIGTGLALVTIGLVARYLSKTEWGEYSIMLTFGGIFSVFSEWGLYQLLVREISKKGADEKEIAGNIFTMRLFISLFIFLLAPLCSLFFPYSGQARIGILVGMAGFWLLSGSQVLMGVFQKYLRMDKVALTELVGRTVQLGLVFLFVKANLGFLWIVGAMVFGGFANFFLIIFFVQKYIRVNLRFNIGFWARSLKQSFPLAIANIFVIIYFSTDSLFLSFFRPSAEVGIYRLPYKVLESLIFFPSMFIGLVMPLLSGFAFSSWEKFKNIFQRSQDALVIFAVPLVAGTFLLSPAIILLLGGGNYPESAPLLNILMIAVGIIFLGTLFSFSLIAIEKQKSLLWISGLGAVFNVAVNLIFMQLYSAQATYVAAITTVLTEFLVSFLMLWVLVKTINFFPSFKVFWKSVLAALAMVFVIWPFRNLNFFAALALAPIIYFSILHLLKGFSFSEFMSLIKKNVSGQNI